MAEPWTTPLPGTGQKPWSHNPNIEELRSRVGITEDFISSDGIQGAIVDAAAGLNPETLSDAFIASQIDLEGSETASSLESKAVAPGEIEFNILRYGAVGGSADDTAAVMAAINASGGKPVFVPPGRFRVNLNVTTQDLVLRGPGELARTPAGPALTVERPMGGPRAVTSFSTLVLGAGTGRQRVQVISTDVSGIIRGDAVHVSSADPYPFSVSGGNGVYQAEVAAVAGVGLTSSVSGGAISPRVVVTGASSGASGTVSSVTVDGTNQHLIFNAVKGQFQAGETLQVLGVDRGITAGTAYLISNRLIVDSYATAPVVRLMSRATLDLDVNITGDQEDPYAPVGSTARRAAALQIGGQVGGRVNARVFKTYGRGVQLRGGCYNVTGTVWASDLPNIADEGEQAYGYGLEVWGAAEMCHFKVFARNLRHGVTTNVNYNSSITFTNLYSVGVPKDNIFEGTAVNCLSTGFDTHEFAYRTKFMDCTVRFQSGAGQYLTMDAAAYTNRGFATEYINCTAWGCKTGFDTAGHIYQSPENLPNIVTYRNCHVVGYAYSGFEVSATPPASGSPMYVYENCTAAGDGAATNEPYYNYGFLFGSCEIRMTNCVSSRFNGAPYGFRGSSTSNRVTMIDCVADYTRSSSTSAIRLNSTDTGTLALIGYKVISNSTSPAGYVRSASSGTLNVTTEGVIPIGPAKPLSQGGTVNVTLINRVTA